MVDTNITIDVPLRVGDRVVLYEDVDVDEDEGLAAGILFEGYVDQYVPETGLLRFENNDVGRAEFLSLIDEAEGFEILKRETLKSDTNE